MKKFTSLILIFIIVFGIMCITIPATAADKTAEVWKRCDISFTSSKSYKNAFLDVDISAVFRHSDGTTIKLSGFWNGGSEWVIRFSPTKEGIWSYVTTCSDISNSGLHNKSGTVKAVKNTGTTDLDKHGFVKITGRYFSYDDGTPFYWLGDTNWQAPNYVSFTKCNYPGCSCSNQFKHEVDDRLSKGFTVYQTYFDAGESDGGGQISVTTEPKLWSTKYKKINPNTFKNKIDKMFDYLAEKGMVIALGFGVHTNTPRAMGEEALINFVEYVTARYASYPIVWITAQEITDTAVVGGKTVEEIWCNAAKKADELDGYNHPMGAHMYPMDASDGRAQMLNNSSWHDWWTLQGGHGAQGGKGKSFYQGYYNTSPTKPIVETEANYEDIWCGGFTGYDSSRVSAWKANQSGSVGFTYGATGVWANCYSTKNNTGWMGSYSPEPWYMGIEKQGSFEMKYLRQFYEYVGFQNLIPRFNDTAYSDCTAENKAVSSNSARDLYVAYFYNKDTSTGTLRGLKSGNYSVRWYNPLTGKFIDVEKVNITNGTYTMPKKPNSSDWTLLVTSLNLGSYKTEAAPKNPIEDTRNDYAKNKTATASTENGDSFNAQKAIDGNPDSYWCATGKDFPQWLQIDFGTKTSFKQIILDMYPGSIDFSYVLEGSQDGKSYTTLVTREKYTPSKVDTITENISGSYRYLKITFRHINGNWAAVNAFKVYDSVNIEEMTQVSGKQQSPLSVKNIGSAIYTAGESKGLQNTEKYLIDGNTSTEWKPFAPIATQAIFLDMGVKMPLTGLDVILGKGSVLPAYRIEGSNDMSDWTIIANSINRTARSFLIGENSATREELNGSYRYIKLFLLGAPNNESTKSIAEIRVFANYNGPKPTPTVKPTSTPDIYIEPNPSTPTPTSGVVDGLENTPTAIPREMIKINGREYGAENGIIDMGSVLFETTALEISVDGATVEINKNSLEIGENTVEVIVTFVDGSTKNYTVKVLRLEENVTPAPTTPAPTKVPATDFPVPIEKNDSYVIWIILGTAALLGAIGTVIFFIIKKRKQ